jgi:hypothetical protein
MSLVSSIQNYQQDLSSIIDNCKKNIKLNEEKMKELLINKERDTLYILSEYKELKNKIKMINKEFYKHNQLLEITNDKMNYIFMIKKHDIDIGELKNLKNIIKFQQIQIIGISIISLLYVIYNNY